MTTVSQVIASIGAFLQPFMPAGTKIVRGQTNNVPSPLPPSVVLTPVGNYQYTTTRSEFLPAQNQMSHLMPKRLAIQMDFYGREGGDMSDIAITLLRSIATINAFPEGVTPLYCSDAIQAPLTTGEKQYEDRWTVTLSLQYNSPVLVNQDSFNVVGEVTADPVNVTIPVE